MAVVTVVGSCSSGGGDAKKSTAPTSGAVPPPLGKPNPLGAKWDWSRLDAFKPYLASLSGGATFYDFAWCEIEPQEGKRDWSSVDRVANAARDLGFELYLKIRTGSCWATTGEGGGNRRSRKDASSMPKDMNTYATFMADVVKRYSPLGVHEYAVENEVNAPLHWDGTAADYVTLVTAAGRAMHGADAQARVADAGLGSTVYGQAIARQLLQDGPGKDAVDAYTQYYDRRFAVRAQQLPRVDDAGELREVLASGQAARNLEFYDATVQLVQEHLVDVFEIHFYEKYDNVPALLDLLHGALPKSFPVQAWEVGEFWPDAPADENVHADELRRKVTMLLDGGVQRVIWLPLAYNPAGRNNSELRFGLVDPDGRVRESGRTFSEIAAAHARS